MAAFGDSRCWLLACVSLGRFAPHLGGRHHLRGMREQRLVQPGPQAAASCASTPRRCTADPGPLPQDEALGSPGCRAGRLGACAPAPIRGRCEALGPEAPWCPGTTSLGALVLLRSFPLGALLSSVSQACLTQVCLLLGS